MAITPAKKIAKKAIAKKSTAPKKTAAKKLAAPKKASAKKVAEPKKIVVKKVAIKKTAAKKTTTAKVAAPKASVKVLDAGTFLALTVAQGMFEKKAENIKILDMRKIAAASADFFVIGHASSDKQVEAIAKSVEEEVDKRIGENPISREGFENMEWILIDYFNVVAHVFQEEKRGFYGIEELWGDAEEIVFKGK